MSSPTSNSSGFSPASSSKSFATALTFGVELEGIFAFHQEKLTAHLRHSKFSHASIVKDLGDEQRKGLHQAKYRNQVYRSWALANAGENFMTAEASVEHEEGLVRAYKDEPLYIAQELLSMTEQGREVLLFNPEDHAKPRVYKSCQWIITADDSLEALKENEKVAAFPSTITDNKKHEWDTYGIELVSPPYSEDELSNAEADISSLLSSLDTPTSGITTNTTGGFHVHIGTPTGECLPIKVLQHLSTLLIIYEDQISRLHPPHRRGRTDEIESNKLRFAAEYIGNEPLDFIDRLAPDLDNGTGETVTTIKLKKHESRYKAIHEIHRLLFDEVDQAENPIAQLQKGMGPRRGMTVNFAYLDRPNGPQTIEFRQHAASVDGKEISYWVRFCLGLVKLAWRFADGESEYKVKHWGDRVDILDLMGEMGLEEEVRSFYEGKIEEYGDEGILGEEELWQEVLEGEDSVDLEL